jgi:glycyl-tRNA synthetase
MTIGDAVAKGVVNNETLGYFLVRDFIFLTRAGVKPDCIRFRQHLKNEKAHYASDCWDAEIKSSYGWVECIGNADRACYDLGVHEAASGTRMSAFIPFPDGPRDAEVTTLVPNKGLIGKQFKADGKKVLEHLDKLTNQEQILNIKNQLEKNGAVTIEGLSVPKDMLAFKTEMKKIAGENIQPSVIEPSFGLGRIMYSILEHAYNVREGDEQRAYLSLSSVVAPIKCAVLPLMVKDELIPFVSKIEKLLTKRHVSCRSDLSGVALGRKYARTDEIGTPFAATIDYDTIKDDTVTLRERDSMQQVRVPIADLANLLNDLIDDEISWAQVTKKYPLQQVKDA